MEISCVSEIWISFNCACHFILPTRICVKYLELSLVIMPEGNRCDSLCFKDWLR